MAPPTSPPTPSSRAARPPRSWTGCQITGWFTEDFTLAELKTLRAVERLPGVRPENTAFNGLYAIPTLDEVLDLARHSRTCNGGEVGVYPETKHPTYFKNLGLSTDQPVLDALQANGMDHGYPVFIQSFETTNLKQLDKKTDVPLVQLIDCAGAPYDLRSTGDPTTYADLVTRAGLRKVSKYADGIGPCKDLLIPRDAQGRLLQPTAVIGDAHRFDLVIHPYTFRVENQFLPAAVPLEHRPQRPGRPRGRAEGVPPRRHRRLLHRQPGDRGQGRQLTSSHRAGLGPSAHGHAVRPPGPRRAPGRRRAGVARGQRTRLGPLRRRVPGHPRQLPRRRRLPVGAGGTDRGRGGDPR